jgi:hypothetical protein
LLAKPTPLNINLGSDRFSMFNNERDISAIPSIARLARIMQQVQGFCMSVEQACVSNSIA